jgi:NADH-quinone oxidoreductase subunit E/NADP-reducing hydrogenase subunit HndA
VTKTTENTDLDARIVAFAGQPEKLIGVLHLVQEELGHVPTEAQTRIAEVLDIPIAQVYGVVTFYHFFRTHPVGVHTIRLCLGTACHVRGAGEVLGTLESELGVEIGGTTDDGLFTLEAVRCLGTCALAPVMMIDDDVHGRLTPQSVREIIASIRAAKAGEAGQS